MFDAVPDSPDRPAPAETSARERMGILRRFSEIGLRMAERLDRRSELAAARAEAACLPDDIQADEAKLIRETASAFAQVARAVSICVALEERIERGPPRDAPPLGADLVRPHPRESRLTARREQVETGVRNAIELACRSEPARIDRLCNRLFDLLDRELAAVDRFLARPVDDIVADLCDRLGVDPELARLGPSPGRGRVTSGGPECGPHAIANDLAIAARNAAAKAEAGPIRASEWEDGVTDAARESPLRRTKAANSS